MSDFRDHFSRGTLNGARAALLSALCAWRCRTEFAFLFLRSVSVRRTDQ